MSVSCMNLKKMETYLRVNLLGPGPRLMKKRIYRAAVSQRLRNTVLDHTQRRTTLGRTPLDEWSARRRGLYLTTHNTHNRLTFMSLVGFEPTISAGERPQADALDRAASGTGIYVIITGHIS